MTEMQGVRSGKGRNNVETSSIGRSAGHEDLRGEGWLRRSKEWNRVQGPGVNGSIEKNLGVIVSLVMTGKRHTSD